MIRVALVGATGRMGQAIIRVACDSSDILITGAVTAAQHAHLGRDAGEAAGVRPLDVALTDDLANALAGADVKPTPFDVEIRGVLMTGGDPVYLSAKLSGTHELHSHVSSDAGTMPSTKIAARYLGPYLERRDRETQG